MASCDHITEDNYSCPRASISECDTCGKECCNEHVKFCDHCLGWFCIQDYMGHVCKYDAATASYLFLAPESKEAA